MRVENEPDAQLAKHVGRAADVVALGMREDERSQAPDAETAQLIGDARVRRALVDEQPHTGRLDEAAIALPHVQERDSEPGRRRRRFRGGACDPGDERERGHGEEDERAQRTCRAGGLHVVGGKAGCAYGRGQLKSAIPHRRLRHLGSRARLPYGAISWCAEIPTRQVGYFRAKQHLIRRLADHRSRELVLRYEGNALVSRAS